MNDFSTSWTVPERLGRLKDLAYNLWWSWHPEARALFKEIDLALWASTHHNPVSLLQHSGKRLEQLAQDEEFLARYDAVIASLDEYLTTDKTWFQKAHPEFKGKTIAYFSAEFGVHNSLRIYSGGLGILAGDHCKTASDLGVPLVGVGFMYPQGYGQQRISTDGWQHTIHEHIDWANSPVRPVLAPSGERLKVNVGWGGWDLWVYVWEVVVGRVKLYLMDTHVDANSVPDREISGKLYGGDRTMRLRQEIVLGVGGVKVLRALNVPAAVYHANEGHCSFLFLEVLREKMAAGTRYEDALREVAETSAFTTHTPVEAGHDVFDEQLVAEYFKNYWPELGLDQERFMALGRSPGEHGWNMTVLSLKMAGRRNAVSRRHGFVSRHMWNKLWATMPEDQVPISYVTNGVHMATWVQAEMARTFQKHLGDRFWESQDDQALWSKVAAIPDEELWAVHVRNKQELFRPLPAGRQACSSNMRLDCNTKLNYAPQLDKTSPLCYTTGYK
jgi:starch phosphorylase